MLPRHDVIGCNRQELLHEYWLVHLPTYLNTSDHKTRTWESNNKDRLIIFQLKCKSSSKSGISTIRAGPADALGSIQSFGLQDVPVRGSDAPTRAILIIVKVGTKDQRECYGQRPIFHGSLMSVL